MESSIYVTISGREKLEYKKDPTKTFGDVKINYLSQQFGANARWLPEDWRLISFNKYIMPDDAIVGDWLESTVIGLDAEKTFHLSRRGYKGAPPPTILAIINGEAFSTNIRELTTLGELRDEILKRSRNTGRPGEDWEIRGERGEILSADASVFGFHRYMTEEIKASVLAEPRLFLSLKIGAGGYLDMTLTPLEERVLAEVLSPELKDKKLLEVCRTLQLSPTTVEQTLKQLKYKVTREKTRE